MHYLFTLLINGVGLPWIACWKYCWPGERLCQQSANTIHCEVFLKIVHETLTGSEILGLLEEHLRHMIAITPPGCVHALDLDALRKPEITFWSVWDGSALLGCGALKELNRYHAEIKSMRTATVHQRKGVASHLLRHMLAEAKRRNYRRISLETGSYAAFEPARHLYATFGFTPCGPFANYEENANSAFMTLEL